MFATFSQQSLNVNMSKPPSQFRDRTHAGNYLASVLASESEAEAQADKIVLALPRGGVPIAFPIARALDAPLDLLLVRKLGIPGHEEYAMGALAAGGVSYINEDVIQQLGIKDAQVQSVVDLETRELERRNIEYRGGRLPLNVQGKIVYLVDDGIATGATMRASILAIKQMDPKEIVVVAPVGAPDSCREMGRIVDRVVVPLQPRNFNAVGLWYNDFPQTDDKEVLLLLEKAKLFGSGKR
ncbi:UNVERIFIED_CONTAM: hypothetical protein HDU68_010196 [Siphonaria sp. JEL0065]|nr:hypothetical protein HDU68_010196 [Siphonaria sp. JEL0065]